MAHCRGHHVLLPDVPLQEVSGELFAYDKQANMFLLRQKGSTPFHHHLQLLRKSQIKARLDFALTHSFWRGKRTEPAAGCHLK